MTIGATVLLLPSEQPCPSQIVASAGLERSAPQAAAGEQPIPPTQSTPTSRRTARKLRRDVRTLALFIETYCGCEHRGAVRAPVHLRPASLAALLRRPPVLCPECARLLGHATVMRSRCPYDPKPMCKDCPTHCYGPLYRQQIRRVMRIAGWRLLRTGRLHYLLHLLF